MSEKKPSNRLSRRDFVKAATTAIGGFMGLVMGVPFIGYLLSPALRESKDTAWIDLGSLDKYPVGTTPTSFDFTQTSVNGWERTALNYGVYVVRQDEKTLRVLSNICTHLGCHVTWHPDIQHYVSPCHDGHFDLQGKVVSGPPPRPLDEFITKVENDHLFIQLPPFKREA